jgi:HlyD family secretion protein
MDEEAKRAAQARRRARRRVLKRSVYTLGGIGVVAAITVAWMPRPVPAEIATATRGPLRVTVDEDGQARVKDRYVVSAPLAGTVGRIARDPGDPIQQGDVLARIAPVAPALLDVRARTTAQARLQQSLAAQQQSQVQIDRAKTAFEGAREEAERQRQLVKRGAGVAAALDQAELAERRAAHELDATRFGARVSEYEVEMARAALERMPGGGGGGAQLDVPSPINGRVLKVLHKSEGVVQPGTALVEVGDPDALEVAVDVLTSDAARIRAGAPVTLDRWGGPDLEGRVRRIEPSAFTRLSALGVEEQRVNLLVDLTSPRSAWAALGDGYRVEAHIVVWDGSEVVRVPTSALFRAGDKWALFRVEGGRAKLTSVNIGHRTAREAEVISGVNAGDRVVAHPSDRITDGIRVAAP